MVVVAVRVVDVATAVVEIDVRACMIGGERRKRSCVGSSKVAAVIETAQSDTSHV